MSLQLEEKHWNIIKEILGKHSYQFYAYGSRVKGTARKFSDLDICFQEKVPLSVVSQLVRGLRYLHSEGVLYHDLKSHNILR